MSRVGKSPIFIPTGVIIELDGLKINVKGPKGELTKVFVGNIEIVLQDKFLVVKPLSKSKKAREMWGTTKRLIENMVKGVTEAFTTELELSGVGLKASVSGEYLNLALAKSHNTKIKIPQNLKINVPKPNQIILESVNKELLGEFVSITQKQRPPEPYKGKGIKIKGQYVQRKQGKKN